MSADGLCLECHGLHKRFGDVVAVETLDLAIPRGCFYGLLGPNGAGKSTSIGLLTGMLRPTAGTIRVFGVPLDADAPAFKGRIGLATEQPPLFSRLRGREQLIFAGQMQGLPAPEAASRADELLQLLSLEGAAQELIADYSRGMRKKLALAVALIHAPELLFLDEPFEGVDAHSAEVIRKVLTALAAAGATILLTTHILVIAEELCERVGVLHQGKLAGEVEVANLGKTGRSLRETFFELVGAHEALEVPSWLAPLPGDR
ncbi:MAG: ABC transporter ATP-binding protein [Deltaproteobacteria bacterium]|nr:ABC transporter ATP-binding protein [Deltaproteobacteria bacterium]